MTDRATPDELATIYLRGRDVPCSGCGYNRRDGATAECPECSHILDLSSFKVELGARPVALLAMCLMVNSLLGLALWWVFLGEYISGSWNFGVWYEHTMIVLAFLTAGLHFLAMRMLFFVFGNNSRALNRMVWLGVVITINFWLTTGGLALMYYDKRF